MSRLVSRVTLAAGFLGLALAVAAAAEPGEAADPAEAAADAALNPLSSLDKASLEGFREAPLFTPSRTRPKPPPAPVVEAAAPPPPPPEPEPPPPPDLKLAGVATGPEGAVAIVQESGATRVERLRLGDQVGGWLVTGIEPDRLKLTLDDREQQYRLFERAEKTPGGGQDGPEGSDPPDDG